MAISERNIRIETWSILKVLLILLALGFAYLIRDILALLFAALFLAALVHPPARYLATKRIPKGVTVLSLYLLLFGLGIVTFGLLLPPLIEQSAKVMGSVGKSWEVLSSGVQSLRDFSNAYGLTDNLQEGVRSLEGQVSRAAAGIFSTLTDVFGGLVGLIVVLVMAYYMVVQEEDARNILRNFIPEKYQQLSVAILKRVEEQMGAWLIGQMSLCLIIGACYYFGLSIVGIDSALVLALFGGFTEFIPYLGPILGAIPAVILGFTQSPMKALLALIVIVIIQQLEGHVIVPKVMQKAVGLNPLISIVALLVGAKLFGMVGALLAIPVATALSAVLTELYRYSKKPTCPS
ncbi:AI-2E family transporter [Patescibacteria group bacterium]|nr:AI-2E family transporter [Patescibacteria group bacterium]